VRISIQETRDVELPYSGDILIKLPDESSSVITVPIAQEELAPVVVAVELGVPLPMIVIPILLGTVIPVVQVHEPLGILMVSPLIAVCVGPLITAFTSE